MTKRQLEAIVREWQEILGLERHDIRIEWDVDEDGREAGVLALCAQMADYDRAIIKFNAALYPKWSVIEATRTVVHELLHVIMRDLEYMLFKQIDGQLHRDVFNVVEKAHTHYLEQAIDRLAFRFVELAGVDA